ncbi:MAG: YihY/virulence factor BrkB family protein [Chloroflexi bacterium]|nr:MAG: YihY/virulence factor BrkB family protein [Chloroflexota bacterium]
MADSMETEAENVLKKAPEPVQTAVKNAKPLLDFWNKFNNDWSWNLSAALAYNLLMAMFPFCTAALAILGLVLGGLSPQQYNTLVNHFIEVFPSATSAQISAILNGASEQLSKANGILWIITIGFAIYYGSRLFVLMENCFGIIYHIRPRTFIAQNVTAIGMLILFIVLIPVSIGAGALTALAISLLPGQFSGGIVNVIQFFAGYLAAYLLFQAIYIIIPNQKIRFRKSWLGAATAALLLQLYVVFFPLYIEHFLSGLAAAIGSVVILLIFFYYFAMILILGAEINAFFAEGVMTTFDLVTIVSTKTEKEKQ